MHPFLVLFIFSGTVLSIFVNQGVIKHRGMRWLDVPYYLAPLLGAVLVILIGGISIPQAVTAVTGTPMGAGLSFLTGTGPFATIILFLSIAFISLTLEVSGFFRFLAVELVRYVNGSGTLLFIAVYWVSAILALFTSNDILILTLTPFLLTFLTLIDINPVPYLIAEFFAANIFSMVMLIGNETNIIVATTHNIGFLKHPLYTLLPGIAGGFAAFLVLFYLFRDQIRVRYSADSLPTVTLDRWELGSFSLLTGTLLSLGILSMQHIPLWRIGIAWAGITFIAFIVPDLYRSYGNTDRTTYLTAINQKMPWEVAPFLTGFFILVHALGVTGSTTALTNVLHAVVGGTLFTTVLGVGLVSTLAANLMNNIPMTVLFTDVLTQYSTGIIQQGAVYALIIGSNIGANITPLGALAGIMWMKLVNHDEQRISFRDFLSYGIRTTAVTAAVCFLILYLELAVFF